MSQTENSLAERKIDHQLADTIGVSKGGINFDNAGQVMEYAKLMAASGSAVPKHLRGQPGACLGILDDAIRFRINPYALARKSYFVNDILAYEAQVFMAIVNAHAPLKTRPDIKWEGEGPDRRCIVVGSFRDGSVRDYRSPRYADIQPKNSPLWKNDPDQQQSYFSLRGFARRWCPEVILGIHDIDELRDQAMTDVTPQKAEDAAKPIAHSLDDFAAGVKRPSTPAAEGAAESFGSVAPQTAAATGHAPEGGAGGSVSPPLAAADRLEAIDKLLALAADPDLTPQEKFENLDGLHPAYVDTYGQDFADTAMETTAKVVKGELKPAAARKYLGSLP